MLKKWIFAVLIGLVTITVPVRAAVPEGNTCHRLMEDLTYANTDIQLHLDLKEGKANFNIEKTSSAETLTPSIEDTFAQGLYFWMIKGASRLPHPPKKKNILENGFYDVAVPLDPQDRQSHQVIFHYRALNHQNGARSAILKSCSVVDARGRQLGRYSLKSLLRELESTTTPPPFLQLKYNDHLIPFPTIISEEVYLKYHHFFVTFYYNPSQRGGHLRELEDLHDIETLSQLEWRRRKYHRQNMRRWIMERFARYAVVHLALIASTPLWIEKMPGSGIFFRSPQPVVTEAVPPALAQITGPTSLNYFFDGQPVEIFLLKNADDQYSLLLSPAHWDKVNASNQIKLTDSEGQTHSFFVVTLSDGNKALIRLTE